eukprot:s1995_g5.t1
MGCCLIPFLRVISQWCSTSCTLTKYLNSGGECAQIKGAQQTVGRDEFKAATASGMTRCLRPIPTSRGSVQMASDWKMCCSHVPHDAASQSSPQLKAGFWFPIVI